MPYPHTSISSDTRDSLWKQLHVDVHAEFKPMRIPIQELRHMSEGLIVEVGDLLDNEIQLVTNGNVIAHGQLVVVGDKFGVLLTQVPGYEKNVPLESLSEPEAPQAPIQRVHSGAASGARPAQESHQADDTDIDAQLVAYCQAVGLDVALGQQAMVAGFDLEGIVNDANAQGADINDYAVRLLQQNGIDLPEDYTASIPEGDVDIEELDEELDRTTAMMQEMEDLLDETNE